MLRSLDDSVQVRNLHKVAQPARRPQSHYWESTNSPLSPFFLLADTKGKMRKYSKEDELTSKGSAAMPFQKGLENWSSGGRGQGGGSIFFPFSVCIKQWGPCQRLPWQVAGTSNQNQDTPSLNDLTCVCQKHRQTHQLHLTSLSQHARGQRWRLINQYVMVVLEHSTLKLRLRLAFPYYFNKGGPSYSLTPALPDEILPK